MKFAIYIINFMGGSRVYVGKSPQGFWGQRFGPFLDSRPPPLEVDRRQRVPHRVVEGRVLDLEDLDRKRER